MKKINILIILLLPIIFISTVNAEDIYKLDFETEGNYNYPIINTTYKDGYLIADYNYDDDVEYLIIYNAQGKITKKVEVDYDEIGNIYEAIAVNDDIYVTGCKYDNGESTYYLALLNSNLEIQKKVIVEDYNYNYYRYYNSFYGIRIKNDKIQLSTYNNGTYGVKLYEKDLSSYTSTRLNDEEDWLEYYPAYAKGEYVYDNLTSAYLEDIDYKDGNYVAGIYDYSKCDQEGDRAEQNPCYSLSIKLFDETDKQVWSTDITKYGNDIAAIKFIDDYIFVSVYDYFNYDGNYLLILNMQGEIVQTIESENLIGNIEDTPRGFIVSKEEFCEDSSVAPTSSVESASPINKTVGSPSCGEGYHAAYYLYHAITSVVKNGNGKVTVSDKGIAGESVTVTITPDEGYVLGEVKVTDAAGNVIIFTDNTFTMPSSDVTIEVTFVKKAIINPNTSDIAIVSVIILFITSIIIIHHDKKKLKI